MCRLLTLYLLLLYGSIFNCQSIEWRKQLGYYKPEQGPQSKAQYITTDNEGNVYGAGNFEFYCTAPGAEVHEKCTGFFIEKRSKEGQIIWKDSTYGKTKLVGLAIDSSNVYITFGSTTPTLHFSSGLTVFNINSEPNYGYLVKYSYSGTPFLVKEKIKQGNIHPLNTSEFFACGSDTLSKWTLNGEPIWKKKIAQYNSVGKPCDSIHLIVKVGNGNNWDPDSLKKVDIDGNVIWSVPIPGYFRSFDVTDEGEIYLSGAFFIGAYIQKLDKNGNEIWYKPMSNGAYTTLLYDKQHSKLAGTKYFSGPCHFYRMDLNGNVQDSLSLANDIALDICRYDNAYYIAGAKAFENLREAVIIKISDQVMSVQEKASSSKNDIIVFPNPAKDLVTVKFQENINEKISARITNLTGQLISETIFFPNEDHTIQIPLSKLSKGLYLLSLSYNGRVSVCKVSVE